MKTTMTDKQEGADIRVVRNIVLWPKRCCELVFGPHSRTVLLYDRSSSERLLHEIAKAAAGEPARLVLAGPEHGLGDLVLAVTPEGAGIERDGGRCHSYGQGGTARLRDIFQGFWAKEISRTGDPGSVQIYVSEEEVSGVRVPFPWFPWAPCFP